MTIDAAELALITSGQTKVVELKATADALVSRAWSTYLIHRNADPMRVVAAKNAYAAWARLTVMRAEMNIMHADLTHDLIMQYGAEDVGPIIKGPGGR